MTTTTLERSIRAEEEHAAVHVTNRSRLLWRLRRHAHFATAAVVLTLLVLTAVFGPMLPLRSDTMPTPQDRLVAPMSTGPSGNFYLLGTDQVGRDLVARLVAGTRVSMGIAAAAMVFGAVVGTTLALVAGFFRGWADNVIMRVADIQSAFPSLLLAVFVLYKLGPGTTQLIIVLAITNWVGYARLLRAQTLSLRARPFVEAAESLGASPWRQMSRHILPHLLPLLFMVAVLDFGSVMLAEAGLSFLGMGVQPPSASWGSMIDAGQQFVSAGAWWLFLFPGAALFLAVLSVNLTSRWLQQMLGTAYE